MAISAPSRACCDAACSTGYIELPITSQHAVGIDTLPPLHRDPFDRLLISQALTEGITLLTGHAQVANYPGPIRRI